MVPGKAARIRLSLPNGPPVSAAESYRYAHYFEGTPHASGLPEFTLSLTGTKEDLRAAKSQMEALDQEYLKTFEAAWRAEFSRTRHPDDLPYQIDFPFWMLPADELAGFRKAASGRPAPNARINDLEQRLSAHARHFAEGDGDYLFPPRRGELGLFDRLEEKFYQPLKPMLVNDSLTIQHLVIPRHDPNGLSQFDTQANLIRTLAYVNEATGFLGQDLSFHPEPNDNPRNPIMAVRVREGIPSPMHEIMARAFEHNLRGRGVSTYLELDEERVLPPRLLVSPDPSAPLTLRNIAPRNMSALDARLKEAVSGRFGARDLPGNLG